MTATASGLARGLQKARAAYGAALVLTPGPVIWLATGQLPSRRARRVAQVLGIRHLIQAALTVAAPEPAVLSIGGQVDAVHATSMLLLAAVSRAGRRAALTDALTEAAFAAAGFSASEDHAGLGCLPRGSFAGSSRAMDGGEFAGQSAAGSRGDRECSGRRRATARLDVRDLRQADPR